MLSRQIKTTKPKYRLTHRGTPLSIFRFSFRKRPNRIIIINSKSSKHQGSTKSPRLCHWAQTRDLQRRCTSSLTKTLVGKDFFGKYGKVSKVVINKRGNSNRKHYRDVSYAAHITYEDEISASLAVIVLWHLFRVCLNSNIMRAPSEVATDTQSTVKISSMEEIAIKMIAYICTSSSQNKK